MYVCEHVCMRMCAHACVCVRACVHVFVCGCLCSCIYIYVHPYFPGLETRVLLYSLIACVLCSNKPYVYRYIQLTLVVPDVIVYCTVQVAQQRSGPDSVQPLLSNVLRVLLHSLAINQSSYVLQHAFATQRSLVTKVFTMSTAYLYIFLSYLHV